MPFSVFNAAGAALNQSLTDTPVGSIQPFAGASAPSGWLLCDGAAVSRTDYAELFAVLGTTYGTGNGSTTFNVPDLRGRVPAGLDNMGGSAANRLTSTVLTASNTLGATGGAQTHILTTAQLPAHKHGVALKGDGTIVSSNIQLASSGNTFRFASDGNIGSQNGSDGSASVGSDNAHTNTQPTLVVNYIILASSLATRLQAAALPQYVTSLPSSPVDGQTVVYAADAANGVMWTLRYRAASSSSYKWEFVGGPPMYSQTATDATVSVAASTWAGLDGADPTVTVPLKGDYVVEQRVTWAIANACTVIIGLKVGSTEATGGNIASAYDQVAANTFTTTVSTSVREVTAASTALAQRYWHNYGSAQNFTRYRSTLFARPLRVG